MDKESLKERIEILAKSQRDFAYFVTHIFSKSIRGFVGGKFVEDACRYITKYDKTMRVAFRSGFKSTLYHAFVLWNIMFRGMAEDLDIRIFSFNERMANEHVQKIRTYIENNPYFDELINYKPLAENVIKCSWDGKHITTVRPVGMVSFHRGMKADLLLLDDIYSDPSSAIDPHLILKINDIFRGIILKSIKPGGQIHVTGSVISRSDIFFDPEIRKSFHIRWEPAIKKDESGNEVPAWPEMYTLEKLKGEDLRNMGENRFQVEMMLEPFYSTDSFFNKEYLRKKIVNPLLRNFKIFEPLRTDNLVIAGWDLGMKKHPADFQVYEIKDNKAIMIHHKSMKWLYYTGKRYDPFHPSQVEYVMEAIKSFGIDKIWYDNTRGELEGAAGSGLLTPEFIPIVLTSKYRRAIANEADKIVSNQQIEILDDEELLNSICGVTKDLVSIQTSQSHGDAFWALCLAMIGLSQNEISSKADKELRVGSPSVFGDSWSNPKIPKGW